MTGLGTPMTDLETPGSRLGTILFIMKLTIRLRNNNNFKIRIGCMFYDICENYLIIDIKKTNITNAAIVDAHNNFPKIIRH